MMSSPNDPTMPSSDEARINEIRARFEDAARYDRAPRKTNPALLERVRELAARAEVVLHDSDAAFAACHADGLVGWEWMSDHCHLSSSGSAA